MESHRPPPRARRPLATATTREDAPSASARARRTPLDEGWLEQEGMRHAARWETSRRDLAAKPFRNNAGEFLVSIRHRDKKLFAAVTAGEIDAADRISHSVGDILNDLIADIVPVRVVDGLEVIDIEDHQRKRAAGPECAIEHAGQMAGEVAAVIEAGQLIGHRHFKTGFKT